MNFWLTAFLMILLTMIFFGKLLIFFITSKSKNGKILLEWLQSIGSTLYKECGVFIGMKHSPQTIKVSKTIENQQLPIIHSNLPSVHWLFLNRLFSLIFGVLFIGSLTNLLKTVN